MKVKEIARTANIAWSPASHHPIYLAAGTAAQQLDATFSTSAALEIFALDLTSGDREMPVKGTLSSEHRFHKLVWGTLGMEKEETPSGVLVGGTDSGNLVVWNPAKILNGETEDVILFQSDKHTGAVQALDINPFQPNLLASGACDSEIYVWDLNNPDNTHTPGAKSLPPDNISCLAWNRQVQHILASTSPCGRCVVWDLRKNEPIIKVSDQGSMARCKAIEWHPDVATQMVLASEDDRCPVIQMWDLRYATSPMKVLERHQRGVLSIAWCPQDPELLMSCGKDSRILCWNPNSNDPRGEVVYELPCPAQWSFDVKWCPRNPNMICSPSFDGHVSIYSLMGGGVADHSGVDQKMLNDAFDISDSFTASVQHQTSDHIPTAATLKKPPKWLRRPCGASFAFGGKLISFGKTAEAAVSKINLSQVVTEEDLVNRSNLLEGALASGSFAEFCRTKIESGSEDLDSTLWSFLKVNFEGEPRKQFLTLLGYDPNNLAKKIAAKMEEIPSSSGQGVDPSKLADRIRTLALPTTVDDDGGSVFSGGALTPSVPDEHAKTPISESMDPSQVFDAISTGTSDTGEVGEVRITTPFSIPTDDESDGLISQALITGNFESAVNVCFQCDRMADAFLLAIAGGPELLAKTQQMYFQKKKSNLKRLMSVVVNRDWPDVVKSCNLENWREALAILVTYCKPEEFAPLCDLLGQRLEAQQDENYANAMVCYICAGNVEKFVSCWSKTMPSEPSPLELQNLIEKVMILKKAVEKERRQVVKATNSHVSEMLCKYAGILASQGSVEIAMEYLMSANDQEDVAVLRDRLYYAQYPSHVTSSIKPPTFPFPRVDVKAAPEVQPQQETSQVQQSFPPSQVQQNTGLQQQPPSSNFYNPSGYIPTQAPPSHVPTSLPAQNQFSHTPYYHGNPSPTHTTVGYSSQNPSYGGNLPNIPPPTSHGPTTLGNQPPSPGQYNAPPPSTLMGYQNNAPPIPGYGVSNTPGVPTSYPPQPGQPSQPHTEPPPPTSNWSADGTHAIAKKHQPTNYTPPAPITMPIFNVSAEQQPVQTGNPTGSAMPSLVPQGGGVPPGAPPQGPLQNVPIERQPEPVKPVAKGPIPAEHIQLQEAFDGLVAKCRGTAMNQQTKKKLDDVTRKLGALYDKLREQKLSPSILAGLHHIAQACQAADYANGYQAYTNLISSGSFSEISSFMPGIKSLMQVATQLRV